MSNLLERALQTLWQALLGAGIVVPTFTDTAAWKKAAGVAAISIISTLASAGKTWLQSRLALKGVAGDYSDIDWNEGV